MRLLIGAAAAAFLMAAPAAAQDTAQPALESRCGALPATPTFPDGASANRAAMERGQEAYTAWRAQIDTVLTCRNAEMTAWRTQYEALGARNESEASAAAAAVQGWASEVAEYEERQGRSNRGNRNSQSN